MNDVYVSGFCKNGVMIEFETEEEAEKAVEKLKAWQRLKDKGFKFSRWKFLYDRPGVWFQANCIPDTVEELDLLFGGENEKD